MWQLVCIHAAARSQSVYIRDADGIKQYDKKQDSLLEYSQRLIQQLESDSTNAPEYGENHHSYLVRPDLELPIGSHTYVMYSHKRNLST